MFNDPTPKVSLKKLQRVLPNVDVAELERLQRVMPPSVAESEYKHYYWANEEVLEKLEQALLSGNLEEYFYSQSDLWWTNALSAVGTKLFKEKGYRFLNQAPPRDTTLYDTMLANARAALAAGRKDELIPNITYAQVGTEQEWGAALEYFGIHNSNSYMTDEEAVEWAALPDKLTLYIGWQEDDPSDLALIWTLDRNVAEQNAKDKDYGEVFVMTVDKSDAKGYINRHGRREVVLPWHKVDFGNHEPPAGPGFGSEPLES